MNTDLEHVVTLLSLGNGAAHELFQAELTRVIENILDPNTDDTAVREINLKVRIKPDKNDSRSMADVVILCTSKTSAIKGVSTRFYIGKLEGEAVAVEHNPQQLVFDEMKPQHPVAVFERKEGQNNA